MLEELGSTYSLQEQMDNAQTQMKSFLMGDSWTTLKDANDDIISSMKNEFFNNFTTYSEKVKDNMAKIVENSNSFAKLFEEGNNPIDNVAKTISQNADMLKTTLGTCTKEAMGYLGKVMSSINPDITIPEFNPTEFDKKLVKQHNQIDEERPSNKSAMKGIFSTLGGAAKGAAAGALIGGAFGGVGAPVGAIIGGLIGAGVPAWDYWGADDGLISAKGNLSRINDGLVVQNGIATNIDKHDQVLAAKEGGPLDRMLDMIQPRSMPYDSYVKEAPYYSGGGSNNGEIKIAPISITINGSINVNGSSIDLSSQIQNDPNFQNALWGLISQEVSKKIGNTGKMIDPLYNRIQNTY